MVLLLCLGLLPLLVLLLRVLGMMSDDEMSKSVTSDAVRVTRTQVLKENFNFLLKTHVQVFLTASIIYLP